MSEPKTQLGKSSVRQPPRLIARPIYPAQVLCVWVMLWVCAWGVSNGWSQDNPSPEKSTDRTGDRPVSTPPETSDVVYLINDEGKLVKVLAGETMKQFREFVRQQTAPRNNDNKDYSIVNISMKGEIDETQSRASLTVGLDLSVRRNTEVRVPLQMTEATLIGHSYDGEGTLDFERVERTNSVTCLVSGRGDHFVELKMLLPIRKAANSNRMQLTLPSSVFSSLVLKSPRGVNPRPPQQADWQSKTLEDGSSEITIFRVGNKIDLTWQTVVNAKQVKPILRSQTYLSALSSGEEVLLDATQVITATQGSFRKLKVTVPSGFSVLDIQCPTIPNLSFDQNGQTVDIDLDEVSSSRVDLTWSLNLPNVEKDEFTLAGLIVDGCRRHTGMLGLRAAEGYRLRIPNPEPLTQIGVTTFRAATENQFGPDPQRPTHAFRFPVDPFEVKVLREKVAASYAVIPRLEVSYSETSVELLARFEVEVIRGTLSQLMLDWPNFEEEGWEIVEIVDSPVPIEIVTTAQNDQPVMLSFADAIDRTNGKGTIQLRCRKPISKLGEQFDLTLPTANAPRTPPGQLVFKNADNITNKSTPSESTLASVIVDSQLQADTSIPANQKETRYEIDGASLQFACMVDAHERSIVHDVVIEAKITDQATQISQQLVFDVSYERLSQILVLIPDRVRAAFHLQDPETGDLIELSAQPTGFDEQQELSEYRVSLAEPLWGKFRVVCNYSLPHKAELVESQPVDAILRILVSDNANTTVRSTRIGIEAPDNLDVQLPSETWKPELADARVPYWVAKGQQSNVPVRLMLTPDRAAQNFSIKKAAIRTRFQHGMALSQAVYLIDGDVASLTVAFPEVVNLTNLRAWWDAEELTAERFRQSEAKPREFRIEALNSDTEKHFLAIEFTSDSQGFGSLNNFALPAPRFASDVWVAETMWDVVLPFRQHMFSYPDAYMPRFKWKPNTVIWSRQPLDSKTRLLDWLGEDESGEASRVPFESFSAVPYGNSYLFLAFGHQQPIVFQSMSQPAIILIGAGFALLMGFILVRIPASRHVLTFLSICFFMAALGLWRLEPVQLLLQPAVFGFILAVVGASIESRSKRRQQLAELAAAAPQQFLQQDATGLEIGGAESISESA